MARQSNQISGIDKLPPWFKLDKYADVAVLDAVGWYEQLLVRSQLSWFFRERITKESDNDIFSVFTHAAALVRDEPIVDVFSNDALERAFWTQELIGLKSSDPVHSLGVRRMTIGDLYTAEVQMSDDKKRKYARRFFNQLLSDEPAKRPVWAKAWFNDPLDLVFEEDEEGNNKFYMNARVNLALPDHILLQQFVRLLREVRKSTPDAAPATPKQHSPDFMEWCRLGVLPYLDLALWAHETGCSIPNHILADAIFPPGVGGEEVVRKTTARKAEQLISRQELSKLAALAAHEIAERNSQ